jgi:hypothetical protein
LEVGLEDDDDEEEAEEEDDAKWEGGPLDLLSLSLEDLGGMIC